MPWHRALAERGNEGKPKYGGTLRVAFASDIHSGRFTFNRENPPGYETFWVTNNTHNALVTLGPNYDIVPDLATSWEVIDKGKEYVFKLHEQVKFHDGTECDAEVVKWNFDDLLSRGNKSWVYTFFTQVDSTQVVDKHTFKVIMKEPAALLPALAGYFQGVPIISPTAVKNMATSGTVILSAPERSSSGLSNTSPTRSWCWKESQLFQKRPAIRRPRRDQGDQGSAGGHDGVAYWADRYSGARQPPARADYGKG